MVMHSNNSSSNNRSKISKTKSVKSLTKSEASSNNDSVTTSTQLNGQPMLSGRSIGRSGVSSKYNYRLRYVNKLDTLEEVVLYLKKKMPLCNGE